MNDLHCSQTPTTLSRRRPFQDAASDEEVAESIAMLGRKK